MNELNSKYALLLNALDEMQQSPAYAVRRHVLENAERTVVQLETENAALRARLDGLDKAHALREDARLNRAHDLVTLNGQLAAMEAALTTIAGYAGDNGCCPYGCDTPTIAQQALASAETTP